MPTSTPKKSGQQTASFSFFFVSFFFLPPSWFAPFLHRFYFSAYLHYSCVILQSIALSLVMFFILCCWWGWKLWAVLLPMMTWAISSLLHRDWQRKRWWWTSSVLHMKIASFQKSLSPCVDSFSKPRPTVHRSGRVAVGDLQSPEVIWWHDLSAHKMGCRLNPTDIYNLWKLWKLWKHCTKMLAFRSFLRPVGRTTFCTDEPRQTYDGYAM
jgi:hypothetical protein